MTITSEQQPAPNPDPHDDIWQLVMFDMEERRQFGIKKYGVPLSSGDGRDSLVDAYQEALDLAVYLRNEIEKRRK